MKKTTAKGKVSKKFGARYGRTIKAKYDTVMKQKVAKKKCPYCSKEGSVKRLAAGIWKCNKCNIKFAGNAYKI